jgi:hypothetical protein
MSAVIVIGKTSFSADFLKGVTKEEALKHYAKFRKETVIEAHKIANKVTKKAK